MIFLPNVTNVIIEQPKLHYLFADPGKAKFFQMFGFDQSRPQELEAALRQHPVRNPVNEVFVTIHGTKFNVICSLSSPDKRDPCTFSCWIFDVGKIEARFVTAYANPP